MPDKNKPFVVTDRRKFTMEGEPRLDADPSPPREPRDVSAVVSPATEAPLAFPSTTPEKPAAAVPEPQDAPLDPGMPAPPTPAEMEQALAAYQQTAERLDTAVRAANPGMERAPAMSFDQLVQSIYMSSIAQLGGTTPQGQQPQVDLMGARQSIDMLGMLAEKTANNLTATEKMLLDSALFELRMGFLEVTQALARSAAARGGAGGAMGGQSGGQTGGPSIVR